MASPKAILSEQVRQVINWYQKDLLGAPEIAERLHVGIQTVYRFLRQHNIPRRNRRAATQAKFKNKQPSFKLQTSRTQQQKNLRLAGCMLYWAEGAKTGKTVDFTNSDAAMCTLFIRFLREICGVDETRLRGYIYCHQNQNPEKLTSYWSNLLGIPPWQFHRPYICKSSETNLLKQRKRRMQHGLVHIRYNDLKLLQTILLWIGEHHNMGR